MLKLSCILHILTKWFVRALAVFLAFILNLHHPPAPTHPPADKTCAQRPLQVVPKPANAITCQSAIANLSGSARVSDRLAKLSKVLVLDSRCVVWTTPTTRGSLHATFVSRKWCATMRDRTSAILVVNKRTHPTARLAASMNERSTHTTVTVGGEPSVSAIIVLQSKRRLRLRQRQGSPIGNRKFRHISNTQATIGQTNTPYVCVSDAIVRITDTSEADIRARTVDNHDFSVSANPPAALAAMTAGNMPNMVSPSVCDEYFLKYAGATTNTHLRQSDGSMVSVKVCQRASTTTGCVYPEATNVWNEIVTRGATNPL